MPTLYYRMTNEETLRAAQLRLRENRYWSPSRALGTENRLTLRVDYLQGHPPDDTIQQLDPLAHRVPIPEAEQRTSAPDPS